MMLAALYARYSSDRQNDRSVDDQLRLCADHVAREGWQLGPVFSDMAISGATRDRPGLNALLEALPGLGAVVVESLDRLSRDQEDIAAIYKRLRFADVRLVSLADGDVSEIHVGLKGTMAALFLRDLGDKTRRGQIGNVHAGLIPGGRSYGYRPDVRIDDRGRVSRGHSLIDESEADVVRGIFTDYAAGVSPRRIAARLNADGIPAPRGGVWRANTIIGSRKRCNGLLHNRLYAGRIVFNRQRFERDPVTRKRVSRPNPPEQWVEQDAPALRIVDEQLWQKVAARLEATGGVKPHALRRAKHILSGLVECGTCGGTVTVVGGRRWGCSEHRQSGTCTNGTTIANHLLEQRVFSALSRSMLDPEFVEMLVEEAQAYAAERNGLQAEDRRRLERIRDREAGRASRLVDAIADGLIDGRSARDKLAEAERARSEAEAALEELDRTVSGVSFHPDYASQFKARLEDLQELIALGQLDALQPSVRSMIGRVVMCPHESGRGAALELQGTLAAALTAMGTPKGDVLTLELVAGAGFEPATFRL